MKVMDMDYSSIHHWKGSSGKSYQYEAFGLQTSFHPVPANFVFAKKEDDGWTPTYVGSTENLQDLLANHRLWGCARRLGSTHIHIHTDNQDEIARLSEAEDLKAATNTICNSLEDRQKPSDDPTGPDIESDPEIMED